MNLRKIFLLIALFVLIITGCAHHSLMRGTVAMKISDTEAHVCINNFEVKEGERVTLFRNVCPTKGERLVLAQTTGIVCKKVQVGMGTVTKILNEHYSIVKFDTGVTFDEGSFIEKY